MKKLNWGLIGGGEDSQIGGIHRLAAVADGRFRLAAGALDIDPDRGREYAVRLGVAPDRAYGTWRDMLAGEVSREDRLDLVTVATPNVTHHEIAKAFLENGFHVFCEKPLTTNPEDSRDIVATARRVERLCAVNYCYSGYPMVRHMMAVVRRGDLGHVRVVFAEFAGGFYAAADDAANPRVRWRFDPEQAGVSAITADAGIHALHMACFVTGQRVASLSADFASCVPGRRLEDDSMVSFRMSGGTVGRLWSSGLAVGRWHGLTLQVFGEKGGFRWTQEHPDQLYWTPMGQPTRILERSAPGLLTAEADRASRITVGHPEGMPLASGNIYRDLADVIEARARGEEPDPLAMNHPTAAEGHHSVACVFAAVESARDGSRWVTLEAE